LPCTPARAPFAGRARLFLLYGNLLNVPVVLEAGIVSGFVAIFPGICLISGISYFKQSFLSLKVILHA